MNHKNSHCATAVLAICAVILTALGSTTHRAAAAPMARDYSVSAPIVPVSPAILLDDERPWERMPDGSRRKVYFNDRLTMVLFEVHGPSTRALKTHHHPHDQITYVLQGRARVQVGDVIRVVGPGAVYIAPSNVPHGMQVLSRRFVGLDVFTPTREDFREK